MEFFPKILSPMLHMEEITLLLIRGISKKAFTHKKGDKGRGGGPRVWTTNIIYNKVDKLRGGG